MLQERIELEAWHCLVDALREAGAVTEDDCRTRPGGESTAGQRVFTRIREWGGHYALLDRAHTDRTADETRDGDLPPDPSSAERERTREEH